MPGRSRLALLLAAALIGFLASVVVRTRPADPAARLPQRYRLADLIESEQRSAARLRREVTALRAEADRLRRDAEERAGGASAVDQRLRALRPVAGVQAVRGPGVRVTLDDSTLDEAPSGNVNDLVIHSRDVQAVVNALWSAGAEAIAINGQRLVGTSAVLCVGNTLLLNGTVHSPPYVALAVGASKDLFESDRLVRRLHADADAFGLRFSVEQIASLELPSYRGSTAIKFATPA